MIAAMIVNSTRNSPDLLTRLVNRAFQDEPFLVCFGVDRHVRPIRHGGCHGFRIGGGSNPHDHGADLRKRRAGHPDQRTVIRVHDGRLLCAHVALFAADVTCSSLQADRLVGVFRLNRLCIRHGEEGNAIAAQVDHSATYADDLVDFLAQPHPLQQVQTEALVGDHLKMVLGKAAAGNQRHPLAFSAANLIRRPSSATAPPRACVGSCVGRTPGGLEAGDRQRAAHQAGRHMRFFGERAAWGVLDEP